MKRFLIRRHAPLAVVFLGAALAIGACGGDKDDDGGGDGDGDGDTGGTSNTGGNTNSGGNANTGGGANSGGITNTGGNTNSGGNGETGGGAGEHPGGAAGEGGDGDSCDVTGDVPENNIQTRNADIPNDFDDVTIETDECGLVTYSAEWPHEADWDGTDAAEANMESTQFNIEFPTTEDLTGKTLTVEIMLLDDGRGAGADNGGYDVNLGATDTSDYNEFATNYDDGNNGELYNAGDTATVTIDIPSDDPDFDPTEVFKLFVRVSSKFWGDGATGDDDNPIFDYDTAVFEISSLTVTDTE